MEQTRRPDQLLWRKEVRAGTEAAHRRQFSVGPPVPLHRRFDRRRRPDPTGRRDRCLAATRGRAHGGTSPHLAAGRALLRVADNGPSLPGEALSTLFDPSNPGREGTNSLELAACESLARRYLGKLRASERPGGGVVITLELPAAAGSSLPSNGNMVQAS